jgi:hypothetical protein
VENEELLACTPYPVDEGSFNRKCALPYSLTITHIHKSMNDFIDFLGFINTQLHTKNILRLESFLMPANFSSIVGEFMNMTIPKYCPTLVKNCYNNGHPDLIPKGKYLNNCAQHSTEGIEVKGSRRGSGWQGHNAEAVWLMVFCFDSNTASDKIKNIRPKPFCFRGVYAAKLTKKDWAFSGRGEGSRRTITASVTGDGLQKMKANWVYEVNPSSLVRPA